VDRFSPAARRDRSRDTILRDGSSIRIRDAVEADVPALVNFLRALDPESRRLRFASVGGDMEDRARRWAVKERAEDCSLVAETDAAGATRIIGNGSYLWVDPVTAEAAFVVADAFQGRGVATLLLEELALRANEAGITTFLAEVLPENAKMLEVFRASGFPLRLRSAPGSILVEFPTELTGEARQRFERREQMAAAAAVDALLHPASVAVIGASRRRGTVGGELFHNLVSSGFPGPVYPVNPAADVVQSVAAYRSVLVIPGPVDLAIVVLPAEATIAAVRECAAKGVRSVVVLSPGFAEAGPDGAARQRELVAACRDAGMRLVGPNAMGVINLEPGVRLNATFSPTLPVDGHVGFLSQSGALGIAIIEHANRLGLGLSSFISIGNKADLSGNDFLQYWEGDLACRVIALYLESLGNPRKFSRIARRVGRTKPIIAVKSGRSAAGARATQSHTGARIGASDVTVDALFRQAGVVRTDTLGEFFDVASLLANQPLPLGRGVAILTNGGGPGILAADACEAGGLAVPPIPEAARRELAGCLPAMATLDNPVDAADAPPEAYGRAIRILAGCDDVHAIIVLFVPPLGSSSDDVAAAIHEAAASLERPVPVLAVFLSAEGGPAALRGAGVRVPAFTFPEEAARALAHAVRYAEWRMAPEGSVPAFHDIRVDEAAGLLATALATSGSPQSGTPEPEGRAPDDAPPAERSRWLRPDEVANLLDCYGIRVADWRMARTPAEAGAAALELGGPVALKAVVPGIVRKRDAGAVRLGLEGAASVQSAAEAMTASLGSVGRLVEAFLVQRMVAGGTEMLVGVAHDRLFGPVIACGAGDAELERLKDVAVRITPLTDRDAADMLRSLSMYPLLAGARGGTPADIAALEQVLLRVSAMVEAHPEIVEIDCNPVIVLPEGAVVVDARVRIEAPEGVSAEGRLAIRPAPSPISEAAAPRA
jgi:acyl-CoA synthetase (NDP forming)/GNAT superfamily N-acetyltransferase